MEFVLFAAGIGPDWSDAAITAKFEERAV